MCFHDQQHASAMQCLLLEVSRTGLHYLFIILCPFNSSFCSIICFVYYQYLPFQRRKRAQMATSNHIMSILGRLPFRDVQTVCPPPIHSTKGLTSNGFGRRGAYSHPTPMDVSTASHAPASRTRQDWNSASVILCQNCVLCGISGHSSSATDDILMIKSGLFDYRRDFFLCAL